MSETTKNLIIVGIALVLGFTILLVSGSIVYDGSKKDLNAQCAQRFGQGWEARGINTSEEKCVNRNGEVKYL